MVGRLDEVVERHATLTEQLSAPDLDPRQIQSIAKERAQLDPIVVCYQTLEGFREELEENKALLEEDDAELREMAQEELKRLAAEIAAKDDELKVLLLPRDPNDEKDIILEIRAGTGGDEASLFAGELFGMYSRYALSRGWKVDLVSSSEGGRGGFKEVIAQIHGSDVYSHLKFEAGVHRVQRVPETESQGRIHTSACTVAIMPEAQDVDIKIEDKDIRVDVFRASGPGGQSVNTTDSAVRITHIESGLVVQCQDEKSQLKNKNQALKVLRTRLYDQQLEALNRERSDARRAQVGSGDRSEKIRTYNFPQDRCTDHRIGLTVHNLPKLFSGELDEVIDGVRAAKQTELLKALGT